MAAEDLEDSNGPAYQALVHEEIQMEEELRQLYAAEATETSETMLPRSPDAMVIGDDDEEEEEDDGINVDEVPALGMHTYRSLTTIPTGP